MYLPSAAKATSLGIVAKAASLGVAWQPAIQGNQQCSSSQWWVDYSTPPHATPPQSARPLSTPKPKKRSLPALLRRFAGHLPDIWLPVLPAAHLFILQAAVSSAHLFCQPVLQLVHLS